MEWKIEWMQCKPAEGLLTDVVITAGWRCTATDQGRSVSAYGSVSFSAPGDPFTPYADLTETQVLGWVWDNGVDKAEVEANLGRQLADLINPPVVQYPLPWGA